MVVTAKGSGVGALHVTLESTMYQSAQGFCPFNRAAAGRINKGGGGEGGGGGRSKVIVIASTPKLSPKTDLSFHTKKPTPN